MNVTPASPAPEFYYHFSRHKADFDAARKARDTGAFHSVVLGRQGFAVVRVGDPSPQGAVVFTADPATAAEWLEARAAIAWAAPR